MFATIDDLKPLSLQLFRDQRGVLVPIELPQTIPFRVARFFWIFDVPTGATRGSHGHKACHQYLVCAAGSLRVDAFDGLAECSIALTAGQALHIPPAIFSTERFEASGSVLMVFCDRPFEPDDYLTDPAALIEFRQAADAK